MKPYRSEALLRIRINTLAVGFLAVTTYLLPIPSIFAASRVTWRELRGNGLMALLGGGLYELTCLFESLVMVVIVFNIVQAGFALRFPRKPLPPKSVPPTPKINAASPMAQKKKLSDALSPSAASPQRPFPTPGTTKTFNVSLASPSLGDSPGGNLNSSTFTFGSSLGSPSPVLSAYRGKHSSGAGRALDAPFLNRLLAAQQDDDDDDDEISQR
ncbi:hypothetical protein EYR40_008387 [Pleurotus pulmonarius]|nr:hypothetical protein EYR36_009200 [Pleurotus pulmonarius]KAF4592696.1 hypothetical protein EYR38_008395 [Pleurotus pulmonarius]KAF4593600.1 hypothetical protein EYR40_008387 [Pleurotus pulmonarius]